MSVKTNDCVPVLSYTCKKCHSKMLIPRAVVEQDAEQAVFQCPECNEEGTMDISRFPLTDIRIHVT